MGYVLELLPKEIITDNGADFLNANGVAIGRAQTSTNIPSDVPIFLQNQLNEATQTKILAEKNLSNEQRALTFKEKLLSFIKEKVKADNTVAWSEAIVMAGHPCVKNKQIFDVNTFQVSLDKAADISFLAHADGCASPANPASRKPELDWVRNYANNVLPSEISAIKSNIKKIETDIDDATKRVNDSQKAINEYLQTKAQYDLKQAEAKNYPEAQRIQAEKEKALRTLEIQAVERSQRTALRSKNIRLGLIIGGGVILLGIGYYLMRKKK